MKLKQLKFNDFLHGLIGSHKRTYDKNIRYVQIINALEIITTRTGAKPVLTLKLMF